MSGPSKLAKNCFRNKGTDPMLREPGSDGLGGLGFLALCDLAKRSRVLMKASCNREASRNHTLGLVIS